MPKKVTKKKSSAKATKPAVTSRVRKLDRKQTKAKAKKEVHVRARIPSAFTLTAQVFNFIKSHWKVLGGIVLVYLILNVIFSSGVASLGTSISAIKSDLNNTGVHAHPLVAGVTDFLVLVASAGAFSSTTGSTLLTALTIIESLVIIWAVRHLLAGQTIGVKQAYYSAMTPLIPFLLVILFVFMQLLPLTFGSLALSAIASSLGTISGAWSLLFGLIFILLAAWSAYMLSASIFAVYIVTLPGMLPREALRSAKKLVEFRRLVILRKLLFLPILIVAVMTIVIIPLILYATFLVAPVFYILVVLSILFGHTYLYSLYRSLLA